VLKASSGTWTPGGQSYASPTYAPPLSSATPAPALAGDDNGDAADFAAYLAASCDGAGDTPASSAASDGDADFLRYMLQSRPKEADDDVAASASAVRVAAPEGPSFGLAARLKITQLVKRFPMVPAETVEQCFVGQGTDVDGTAAALREIFGEEYDIVHVERAAETAAAAERARNPPPSQRERALAFAPPPLAPQVKFFFSVHYDCFLVLLYCCNNNTILFFQHAFALRAHDVTWVESGSAVAADYAALRGEATQQSILRNKFFEQATAAYNRGDSARAKKLSSIGKGHQVKADLLHAQVSFLCNLDMTCSLQQTYRALLLYTQAARAILEKRTAALEPKARATTLDLHGLHVAEAYAVLAERLPQMTASGHRTAVVITGAGEHSRLGKAHLLDRVRDWLRDEGYTCREKGAGGGGRGRGGTFIVQLQY
tara:strand:- start:104 stop:1390 length:1287 start_codon:yes stop_codon:yes gene_type:complete